MAFTQDTNPKMKKSIPMMNMEIHVSRGLRLFTSTDAETVLLIFRLVIVEKKVLTPKLYQGINNNRGDLEECLLEKDY